MRSLVGRHERGHDVHVIASESVLRGPGHPRLGNPPPSVVALGLRTGADERKVKQVLLNLLSNALKFTPEGGRIDVRAAVTDGVAEISVVDTSCTAD